MQVVQKLLNFSSGLVSVLQENMRLSLFSSAATLLLILHATSAVSRSRLDVDHAQVRLVSRVNSEQGSPMSSGPGRSRSSDPESPASPSGGSQASARTDCNYATMIRGVLKQRPMSEPAVLELQANMKKSEATATEISDTKLGEIEETVFDMTRKALDPWSHHQLIGDESDLWDYAENLHRNRLQRQKKILELGRKVSHLEKIKVSPQSRPRLMNCILLLQRSVMDLTESLDHVTAPDAPPHPQKPELYRISPSWGSFDDPLNTLDSPRNLDPPNHHRPSARILSSARTSANRVGRN